MDKLKAWFAGVDKKTLVIGVVIGLVLASLGNPPV